MLTPWLLASAFDLVGATLNVPPLELVPNHNDASLSDEEHAWYYYKAYKTGYQSLPSDTRARFRLTPVQARGTRRLSFCPPCLCSSLCNRGIATFPCPGKDTP